ncbi:hypothetical protein Tco_1182494 [Tanacetum coccineum]
MSEANPSVGRCMITRSSTSKLVAPFSNPESIIRNHRRNRGELSILLDFKEINMDPNNNHGPPPAGLIPQNPAPDLQMMEELHQAPTEGVGDAIVLNLVTAISFHDFANDDPHSHI